VQKNGQKHWSGQDKRPANKLKTARFLSYFSCFIIGITLHSDSLPVYEGFVMVVMVVAQRCK
jgi:hypothetical protein